MSKANNKFDIDLKYGQERERRVEKIIKEGKL
jgi:hypothetical protein